MWGDASSGHQCDAIIEASASMIGSRSGRGVNFDFMWATPSATGSTAIQPASMGGPRVHERDLISRMLDDKDKALFLEAVTPNAKTVELMRQRARTLELMLPPNIVYTDITRVGAPDKLSHLLVWIALVKRLQFKVIMNEVSWPQSYYDLVVQDLGELYHVIPIPSDARWYGWKSRHCRKNIVFVAYLRDNMDVNIKKIMQRLHLPPKQFEYVRLKTMNEVNFSSIMSLFHRQAKYNWSEFLFATKEEIDKEIMFARTRRKVMDRLALQLEPREEALAIQWNDPPGSALESLTVSERRRVPSADGHRGLIYDLAHNGPGDSDIGVYTGTGILFFITSVNGEGPRWLTRAELRASQGFPVTTAMTIASCGARRHFDEHWRSQGVETEHMTRYEDIVNVGLIGIITFVSIFVALPAELPVMSSDGSAASPTLFSKRRKLF